MNHKEWIEDLKQDADLLEAGYVITPERVVTTWSHNRAAEKAERGERIRKGWEKAKLTRSRKAELTRLFRKDGLRGIDLRIAVRQALWKEGR